MPHVPRAKTRIPSLPPDFVSRPGLLSVLDQGADRALTLVCAPPGYGKTLLLAEWARSSAVPTAWVALDEEDDDPKRLWTSVLAGLAACPDLPASSPLRSLVVPHGSAFGLEFLTDLVEALRAVPTPVALVLDDVHHLRQPEALHGLRLLLSGPRSRLRLVLSGRSDPVLSVARLRMEERLCELRTEQLTFSAADTALLTQRCGLALSDAQVVALRGRTAGWPAGIRLATLSLPDGAGPDAFLDEFSGDERPVADYLIGEVLSHLTPEERTLLRQTSICDPLPTALAAELSGRADASEILTRLQHDTGLVIASDPHRTEFRVHELLRSYLTVDLRRHGPALVAEMHRRAAEWWSAQGRPIEALAHAEAVGLSEAGGHSLLARLLHVWAPELVARGEFEALDRALTAAERSDPEPDPWRPLIRAHALLAAGDRVAARSEALRAQEFPGSPDDEDLTFFRAATEHLTWAHTKVVATETPPGHPALAALVAAGHGAATLFFADQADEQGTDGPPLTFADARTELLGALDIARRRHLDLLELTCFSQLGALAWRTGDQGRAAAAASSAIRVAADHGWDDSFPVVAAHGVLAHAQLMQGRSREALRTATEGIVRGGTSCDPVVLFGLRVLRGAALFDTGRRTAGLLELQESYRDVADAPVPAHMLVMAALLEQAAALLAGSSVAAASAASRLLDRGVVSAEASLMRAWAEAAGGRPRAARATIAPLLAGDLPTLLPTTLVEAWLVEARCALRTGDRPGGRRALHAAMVQAEPMDLVRPVALAGEGVWVLLVDELGGTTDPNTFAVRCLTARQRIRGKAPALGLSGRERDVLVELTSLSNLGEIASTLDVSVNTVKSHVRAIYGKLGVTTRRSAVLALYDRGLLLP